MLPAIHAYARIWQAADEVVYSTTLSAVASVRAGLVDEYQLLIAPVVVGGGTRFFLPDVRVDLELLAERRSGNGVVFRRYGVTSSAGTGTGARRTGPGTQPAVARALVLRLEGLLQHGLAGLLQRAGRPVRIHTFPGFAASGRLRVGGRVLVEVAPAREQRARSSRRQVLRANLGQFLTVEVAGARVLVEVGGRSVVVVADREGYVDAVLDDVPLAPGRHSATLTPVEPAGEPARSTVHVPHPDARLAVVSDIDDTIVDSGIAHGLAATISTALLRDAASRVPLDGAPELYRALWQGTDDGPEPPFFYLSTSPWNLVGFLQGFLVRHRFPDGPLLLTDWGPGPQGLLRVGTRSHKLTALRRLADVLPQVGFVLIGDSGQLDAEIYAAFALERPGRVAAVYIRRAGVVGPAAEQRLEASTRALADTGVPFVVADDSAAMLAHAQQHGLARR